MAPRARSKAKTIQDLAHARNKRVLDEARAAGFLDAAKDTRLSGRVPSRLLKAAKQRAHVSSDTELLELALARLALDDDFALRLLSFKGTLPPDFDLISGRCDG